jgi:hypothetical protein
VAKSVGTPIDPEEQAVTELLEAIAVAREKARLAYEFSGGSAYAHDTAVACDKVARLAGVSPRKR